MLEILHKVKTDLYQSVINDKVKWNSLRINYHPPVVERLWRDAKDCRIFLHRIHPCEPGQALFHPHPWASVVHIISGEYEMEVGYGTDATSPPVAAKVILSAGSEYEMVNPHGWHSVRPINHPSLSLMVAGKPTGRSAPKANKQLDRLTDKEEKDLLNSIVNSLRNNN